MVRQPRPNLVRCPSVPASRKTRSASGAAFRTFGICLRFVPPAAAGRIEAFLGSGMNFGSSARFRPYLSTENINYIPQAGVSLIPNRDWKYTGTWTGVDAHSFCLFCDARLEESYSAQNLGVARNILHDSLKAVFLGADVMRQTGKNTYTRVHMGFPNGDSYRGALIDRYTLIGIGITTEFSFAGFMSAGTRVGYSWLRERGRSNTLMESIADGDEVNPIVFDSGSRGAPVSFAVFFRLSLVPIRW